MRRVLITGGAGFIGSALADTLAGAGTAVVVYDNLSTGRRSFVQEALSLPNTELVEADVLDRDRLTAAMRGCDAVFHLAANADVRHGFERPQRDLEQNTVATSTVLEAMRDCGVTRIAFASSGSVYGEPKVFPTPEECPFPLQTSLYGASKLAGEAMIQAYSHGYGFTGAIFRLVSILGERYTHGHVFDFYGSLRQDPERLRVLGDGKQQKSYLYVGDWVDGVLTAFASVPEGQVAVFNIGTDEVLTVNRSIEIITSHLGVEPRIEYTGGSRGWPGDSPMILLDCGKLRALGWAPTVPIEDSIVRTLEWFDHNPAAFDVEARA